jgi:hypothetical protein
MAQTMSAAFFSSEVGRMEEIVQAGLILSLTCFGCNGVPMGRVCIDSRKSARLQIWVLFRSSGFQSSLSNGVYHRNM